MESYQSGAREADFQKLAQNIGTNIQKILQNVSSMQRMIAQIGTPQDNQQLQTQLHQIQHYTGQLARDTSKHIKDLNEISTSAGIQVEPRPWKLQRERLQSDFTEALNRFQATQRTEAQKERELVKKAKSVNLPGPGGSGSNLIDVEEGQAGQQARTQLMLEEEQSIQQLQDRERAIRQLESDIADVNTIFKDLATLVHDQGEMVDSIEENVSSAQIRVQEGADQLRQAERYKNAKRKRLMYFGGGIIAFLIFTIFLIWIAS